MAKSLWRRAVRKERERQAKRERDIASIGPRLAEVDWTDLANSRPINAGFDAGRAIKKGKRWRGKKNKGKRRRRE